MRILSKTSLWLMIVIAHHSFGDNLRATPASNHFSTPTLHDELMLKTTRQFEKITYVLESVMDDMRMGSVHVADQATASTQLALMHHFINTIVQTKQLQSDLNIIATRIDMLQQVIEHLQNGVNTHFNQWQAMPPVSRHVPNKSIDELTRALTSCTQQTEHLAKAIQQIGLNRFRKLYRTILHCVERHPTASYRLGALAVTGTLVATLWAIYRKIPYLDRDDRPILDSHNQPLQLKDMPRSLQITELLRISGLIPQLTLIPWALWSDTIREHVKRMHKSISKKFAQLHYYFKGSPLPDELRKTYPINGFEDVRGQQYNKREALKLVECIAHYEHFAEKNIAFQRGLLLLGKTRSGKTFFAEKLCGELNKFRIARGLPPCPFIQVDAGSMRTLSQFGNGLSAYIELARAEAPSVLFIDELHSFLRDDPKILTELLTSMSSAFNNNERPVIIIAATNHHELLDVALRQKGRFGLELMFEYPHFQERKDQIKALLQTAFLELEETQLIALAHETEGYSYEDLNDLVAYMKQEATINKTPISNDLLEQALDAVIRKIKFPEAPLNPDAKAIAAIHHASTVVAIARLNPRKTISKATLLPVELRYNNIINLQLGHVFCYNDYDHDGIAQPATLITACKELLAGHVGEKLFYGTSTYAYQCANDEALALCKQLTNQGVSYQQLSSQLQDNFITAAIEQKNNLEHEVYQLLQREKSTIARIACALQEHLTLTKEQIAHLLIPPNDRAGQCAPDTVPLQKMPATTPAPTKEPAADQ